MVPRRRYSSDSEGAVYPSEDEGDSTLHGDYGSHGPRKRARLSTEDGEVNPESVSDIVEQARANLARVRARVGDDAANDETPALDNHVNGGGSDNEDAEVLQATQNLQRERARLNGDNRAADCGVIESVTCINFMCHNKLEVKLGPLINFIIGHNGSGKSAVLTAITICLGGKATSTNRGQSLKSFIKEGKDNAILSVRIKNQGDAAFKRDVYGGSIIVDRHFSLAGTSGFRLKTETGRLVTTKRSELDEILDFYALQLDNPINVLTQDMARQFLNASTPADKYKFFVKGVQLEQLDNDYKLVGDSLDAIDAVLETVDEDVQTLKSQAQQAQQKLKAVEQQKTLQDTLRTCRRQIIWSQVEAEETELDREEREYEQAKQKVHEKELKAEEEDEAFDFADRAHTETKDAHEEAQKNTESLQKISSEARDSLAQIKARQLMIQTQERDVKGLVDTATRNISATQTRIAAERERLQDENGSAVADKLVEIDEAEEAKRSLQADMSQLGPNAAQLEKAKKDAEAALKFAETELKNKRGESQNAEGQLNQLRQSGHNRFSAYNNENLPNLIHAISNDSGFLETPVGPIGNHIKLLKPEWGSVIEKYLGAIPNHFVVTSKNDQSRLTNLMRRTRCTFPIFIGRSEPIDTSTNQPSADFETLINALRIDDDLVRNQLIINGAIEQVVLIKDPSEASKAIQSRPRNIKSALAMNPNRRGAGFKYSLGQTGGLRQDPQSAYNGRPRLEADREAQIRIAEQTLIAIKLELQKFEQDTRDKQNALVKSKQSIERHQRHIKTVRTELAHAEERVESLREELESMKPQDGLLDALKEQLQTAESEREMHKGQLLATLNDKSTLDEHAKQAKNKADEAIRKEKEQTTRLERIALKVTNATKQRRDKLHAKNAAHEAIKDAKTDSETAESKVQKQKDHLADWTRQAEGVCPRIAIPPGESCESLERKFARLQKESKEAETRLGGTEEEIAAEAIATHTRYDTKRKQLQNLRDLQQTMTRTMQNRHSRWQRFQKQISVRARSEFKTFLSNRQFRGGMRIDHQKRILDLLVQPDATQQSADGRQTKTLSGGEKSFSTICMLLSLWNAMGSPIRCLDEFDVFMDSVNRVISTEMMIKAARESVGRQFILITPQAMGGVRMGNDVRVIRLNDPERNQGVLRMEQAAA